MVCAVEGFESNESARHWARLVVTGDLVNMLPYILHKRGSNVGHAGSPYAKKGSVGRSTIGNSMQLCLGVPELVGVDPGVPRLLAGSVAQGDIYAQVYCRDQKGKKSQG